VATLDIKNMAYSIATDGETSLSGPITNACTKTAGHPLTLYAKATNAGGTTFINLAKMRLYSAKIYEAGTLVHEFLPYKNGAVIGLYDTVTGNGQNRRALSYATAFEIGGMGVDGGGSALCGRAANTVVGVNKTATAHGLRAGAVRTAGRKTGHSLRVRTGSSVTVAWEMEPQQSVYAVTPVFSVNGKLLMARQLRPTVENLPRGMIFYTADAALR
jgi:hypothetical protein